MRELASTVVLSLVEYEVLQAAEDNCLSRRAGTASKKVLCVPAQTE